MREKTRRCPQVLQRNDCRLVRLLTIDSIVVTVDCF